MKRDRLPLMLLGVILVLSLLLLVYRLPLQAQTPLPPVASGVYEGLPQGLTELGFPTLGDPAASVRVTIYCAFDTLVCGDFHRETFPSLLDSVRDGDINITVLPLLTDNDADDSSIENGQTATRAALCAAEQGAFWQFSDTLYGWQAEFGAAAFESARLLGGIDALAIDRSQWDECMLSNRPDATLVAANTARDAEPAFNQLPFVLVNDTPSLTDSQNLTAAIDLVLNSSGATPAAPVAGGATPVAPVNPDDSTAPGEATIDVTETPVVVTLQPLLGEQIEPPLRIALPAGWRRGYDALLLDDLDVQVRTVPVAVYAGPVTDGTGTIVLLWGFPNLVAANPLQPEAAQPDLWADGLRLLRLAVIERNCNIGTDLRRDFTIGSLTAVGTYFAAVDCPELPDTRGWFAGVRESGINFVFYAYTEPITAMDGAAEDELQAILDSVQFDVPDVITATPAP